jgi:hypothetical protein
MQWSATHTVAAAERQAVRLNIFKLLFPDGPFAAEKPELLFD